MTVGDSGNLLNPVMYTAFAFSINAWLGFDTKAKRAAISTSVGNLYIKKVNKQAKNMINGMAYTRREYSLLRSNLLGREFSHLTTRELDGFLVGLAGIGSDSINPSTRPGSHSSFNLRSKEYKY
jgi:hypothetical protein